MSLSKRFCLNCMCDGNKCKCDSPNRFRYSNKLRVPDVKNKKKFRDFLDACPAFVNMVDENSQKEAFINLLRKIKYFDKTINGKEWTNISK